MTCSPPTLKPCLELERTRSSEAHYINLTYESLSELNGNFECSDFAQKFQMWSCNCFHCL